MAGDDISEDDGSSVRVGWCGAVGREVHLEVDYGLLGTVGDWIFEEWEDVGEWAAGKM